jgi:uncharacterized protein YggE
MRLLFAPGIALLLLCPRPLLAQTAEPVGPPVIVTHGDAIVARSPDQAFIDLQVESRAKSPRDAARQNADAMSAVHDRLRSAGLGKDAIRTTGYAVQEEFDFVNNRRVSRGFLARNAVEVRVENVDRVGEILDVAVQNGATSVSGVRFDIKDRAGAEREALRRAVADARARAEAMADGAGKSVDRVLRIEDTREGGIIRPMMRQSLQMAAPDQATPIEAGTIEIHAAVTLTVGIR